jgi:arylformamidase
MCMIVDITGVISDGLCFYGPPVTPVRLERMATLAQNGWDGHRIELTTLSGTYLETSSHHFAGRRTIDQVEPRDCFLDARLARIPKGPAEAITLADMERAVTPLGLQPGQALIIATGWDRRWGQADFDRESPYFTPEAIEWLLARRPALLGADLPAFDSRREPKGIVPRLFINDLLLLAPLVNLEAIPGDRFQLIALPLKLEGACGSPCRAVALCREVGL